MRINVYSQELLLGSALGTELISKEADNGLVYSAVRMFLYSSNRLHDYPGDDDRSAVTFWLPRSAEKRKLLATLFGDLAVLTLQAPPETGLD